MNGWSYLVLHLIDVSGHRGEQLLPTNTQGLHCVWGVAVLKDHGLLHLLVDALQLLDVATVTIHLYTQTHANMLQVWDRFGLVVSNPSILY